MPRLSAPPADAGAFYPNPLTRRLIPSPPRQWRDGDAQFLPYTA